MFQYYSKSTILSWLFLVFTITDFHIDGAMGFPVHETRTNGYQKRRLPKVYVRSKDFETADVVWLNPGKRSSPNLTPFISVGVLSNLEEFFENLSSKMNEVGDGEKNEVEINVHDSQFKNTLVDHQLQGYKPSIKIRNYVQSPEPVLLKGTNRQDPSFKWTGLGKRKCA